MSMTETTPAGHRTGAGTGLALAGGGLLLTAAAVVLSATDTSRDDRALAMVVHALCAGLPVALGLFRLTKQRDDRFAWLLIVAWLAWSVVTFAQSSDPALYAIGRVGGGALEVMIVYLLLAFPEGRLRPRAERQLVGALALVFALLYLPSVLLAELPTPSPYSSCGTSCPHNPFVIGGGAEGLVEDVLQPLREVLSVLIFAAVAAILIRRARRGPPLVTRLLVPVAVVAVFRTVAVAAYDGFRGAGEVSGIVEVVGVVFLLSLALITISFALGLLDRRLFVADALQRLTRRLRPHASAADLRVALAEALQDPSLAVVYWVRGDDGQWVDETGWPVKPPEPSGGRAVTEV